MALYGTYLDLSALSTIREENSVEFPVSSCGVTVNNCKNVSLLQRLVTAMI